MNYLLEDFKNFKLVPTHLLDNKCFACGKDNPEGLHMKFYTDNTKYLISKIHITENKRGWDQVVHGGIISTILDEVMAWNVIYYKKQFMLTKSIKVNYLNSLNVNSDVTAISWIEEQPKGNEAITKAKLYDQNKKLCAEAEGQMALFSKKLALRLKMMDNETAEHFDEFINSCTSSVVFRKCSAYIR